VTFSSRILPFILIATIAVPFAPRLEAAASSPTVSKEDAHQRLKAIEKNRQEVQQHLREAKIKEQAALKTLHHITSALRETSVKLTSTHNDIKKTETKIQDCAYKITQTHTQEESMEDEAGRRLREIYEGQRLGLVDMLFQVSSLQTLLDLFYYQERIADMDRKLIGALRERAVALAAKKDQLGSKKNILGDLISQIAEKASELNKQKTTQEKVAERLRGDRVYWEQAEHQLEIESRQLEHQIVDMCSGKDGKSWTPGSGTLAMPLRAPITSPFGMRTHPIFGRRKMHTGIDLAGPNHSEIRAADSGSVIFTGYYGGYGRVVIISHGKGMATLYAHLSRAAVADKESVHKGQVIGYEGTTGFSTGPHLHFEVRVDGKPNNPLNYVH
jgi:murein DD-endopeptidase MepM/ murein hydrolase activator NlpD